MPLFTTKCGIKDDAACITEYRRTVKYTCCLVIENAHKGMLCASTYSTCKDKYKGLGKTDKSLDLTCHQEPFLLATVHTIPPSAPDQTYHM